MSLLRMNNRLILVVKYEFIGKVQHFLCNHLILNISENECANGSNITKFECVINKFHFEFLHSSASAQIILHLHFKFNI